MTIYLAAIAAAAAILIGIILIGLYRALVACCDDAAHWQDGD